MVTDPRADWAAHAMGGTPLDLPVYGFGEPEAARPRTQPASTGPRQGPGQTVEATRPRPAPPRPRNITEHRERKAAAVAGVLDALGVTVAHPDFAGLLADAGALVDRAAHHRVRPLSADTIRLAVAHLDAEAVVR